MLVTKQTKISLGKQDALNNLVHVLVTCCYVLVLLNKPTE